MKRILLLFGVLLLIAVGTVVVQNFLKTNSPLFGKNPTITINNHIFQLLVAKTPKEKEIGLSQTSILSEDKGMIFPFDKPSYYSFWMKNMKIPIDIIYIQNDEIVTIIKNAKPPSDQNENLIIYNPEKPSDKVLEIRAGLSEEYNFKKGDKVKTENL